MCPRQRRPGNIGTQNGELGIICGIALVRARRTAVGARGWVADQPDEARAEHALGGGEELRAEGLDGGEGAGETGDEVAGHGGWGGGKGGEEVVVVPGHAGMVEEGGLVGVAGVGEEDVFGLFVRGRMTCRHLVESFDQMALVLVPGDLERRWREDFSNAIIGEGFVVNQLRDTVKAPTRSLRMVEGLSLR